MVLIPTRVKCCAWKWRRENMCTNWKRWERVTGRLAIGLISLCLAVLEIGCASTPPPLPTALPLGNDASLTSLGCEVPAIPLGAATNRDLILYTVQLLATVKVCQSALVNVCGVGAGGGVHE